MADAHSQEDSRDVNTQTAFAVIAGVAAIFVALVVLVFYIMRDKTMSKEILDVQRRFDAFKAELQTEQQKKMFKYSKGIQEFLKQYKKPILQSAFDLQSRLTNQVKNNFLYSFLQERGGERDKNYALYNFSFVFAEFLGWLEVIRQEMVFVTGDDDTPLLASLIDGIKFQLTGETPIQGTPPPGQADNPEFEAHSKIFQLYAGELRSIGSVMIITDADGNKSILNADEFQRLMTVKAPPETGGNEAAYIDWARSRERLFQDMMLPLFDHLRHMAKLPKGEAPSRRLAIFQVLLCKLIDLIDNAIPWDSGPKYDPMEEVQYITRDFRLTPLVACLNSFQRSWLASQMFMENAEKMIADELWDDYMEGRDPVWRKLCFCGFREDIAHLPQDERDKKPGMWPGACPPKLCRTRQPHVDPKTGRHMDRSTSFFATHHRPTRERDREPDKKDKDGGVGGLGGLTSVFPIGKHNPSLGARVLAGMPGAMGSGKLSVPASTPAAVPPPAPPAKIPDATAEIKKGGGGLGKASGKGVPEVLPKSSSLERLQQSKLQAAPNTPTSSDADSLNNSTPSSSQLHQQQPVRFAGDGFQAITIKGGGLPPIQAPPHAPPRLPTNPALHPLSHQSIMSSSQQPSLRQLPAAAPTPSAFHLHADSSKPQEGSEPPPPHPSYPQGPPLSSPAVGSLLAGTGIASSAAVQRPPPPPHSTHPLQAVTLAQHTQLQQQQQHHHHHQQQEQHPHENWGPPQSSIQLPNTASPFHVANTTTARVPAIRKWGTQNRMAGMGGSASNRVSPVQGPQPPSSPSSHPRSS